MNANNFSKDYEILIRDLHKALIENDKVENINIFHDVKIIGRSGATHQIDVYWEFKIAGIKYKTCIECKHYSSRVKKSHIATFITVLADIGNCTGIFATTIGYQKGAELLATDNGIRLITVNFLLKEVNIKSRFLVPNTDITEIKYDSDQTHQFLIENELDSFSLTTNWNQETIFYDAKGFRKTSLKELINTINEDGYGVLKPNDIYDKTEIGLLKVSEVTYRRYTRVLNFENLITVNEAYRAIMEDVTENTSLYLHDDGSISKIETNPE